MRQEINLFQLPKKEATPRLSLPVALSALLVFCVCLSGMAWHGNSQLAQINQDIAKIEKNNLFQKKEVINTSNVGKHQLQLKALEKQLLSRYQLWSSYKKITDAGKNGFSKHFYHIANLADKNLSLYEIDVYDKGNSLAIKGYSRSAQYIPVYINHLKKQKEFVDVYFGDLSIEKIKGHPVMRFALAKKDKIEEDKVEDIDPNIDVSSLMNMPLVNADNMKKLLKNHTGGEL